MFVDVLPRWERCFYWIVGTFGIAYSIYILFLEGEKYREYFEQDVLSPGWSWIGRYQDQTDKEWFMWRRALLQILFLNAIHMLLSQICFYFKVSVKIHSCVLLIFDLVAAYVYFNLILLLVLIGWALITYAVSLSGSKYLVWMLAMSCIFSMDSQEKYIPFSNFEGKYHFHLISSYFYIRLISFAVEKIQYRRSQTMLTYTKKETCIDNVKREQTEGLTSSDSVCDSREEWMTNTCHKKKTAHKSYDSSSSYKITNTNIVDCDPSFLDLLFYSFYLPTFTNGPILIYKDFHNQVKTAFRSSSFTPDVYDIVKQLIRLSFWAVFIEFQFHFLYYNVLGSYPEVVKNVSSWAIVSIGYCQGQFFMIKYFVIYGSALQLSRFDGVVPHARPRCISWIYSFTDMWKHFDVGLYNFIKTYIYIPLGGSRAGLPRQIYASGLTFVFIFTWHGAREEIFVWCAGNYLMCSLEAVSLVLEQSTIGAQLKTFLGPAVYLRLKAIIIFPAYLTSMLQEFFFFKMDVGWVFVSRMVTKASWTTLLTEFVIFTACIHNAIYIAQWYTYKKMRMSEDYQRKKEINSLQRMIEPNYNE